MNSKKFTILDGILICPLAVGRPAHIFHQGRYIRTSTVAAIHDAVPGSVRFETINTNYCLLRPTRPQLAQISGFVSGLSA